MSFRRSAGGWLNSYADFRAMTKINLRVDYTIHNLMLTFSTIMGRNRRKALINNVESFLHVVFQLISQVGRSKKVTNMVILKADNPYMLVGKFMSNAK